MCGRVFPSRRLEPAGVKGTAAAFVPAVGAQPAAQNAQPSCDHSGARLSRKAAIPSAVSRFSMFSTITAPVSW